MRNHKQHETKSIEEKASEIKGEIHTLLTDLEMKEKPLRAQNEKIENISNGNKETLRKMRDFIENEMNRLKALFLQSIDESLELEGLGEFQSVISELVEMQQRCRNQLILSDDSLIAKASELIKENEHWKQSYKEQALKAIETQIDKTELLGVEFKRLQDTVLKMMSAKKKINLMQRKWHIAFLDLDYLYQVEVNTEEQHINVSKIDASTERHKIRTTKTAYRDFKSPVTHVFPVCRGEPSNDHILVLFADKTSIKYCISTECVDDVEYPDMTHFLWPYAIFHEFRGPWWSFWSAEANELKFSHQAEMSVKLPSCPKVRMSSCGPRTLYFITSNLNIVIADVDENTLETIPASLHNLSSIDSVSGQSVRLIVWCADAKTVALIKQQKDSQWIKLGNISWLNQTEIFGVVLDGLTYRFMPVLKELSEADTEEYPVYAFR